MQKEKYTVENRENTPEPPKVLKYLKLSGLWRWLCWVTNNEANPKHEIEFDVAFFLVDTVALIFGTYLLCVHKEYFWIPFLIIEYSWALDNMRNNRDYLK